jgi:AraC-like DNA-binding protein
MAAMGRATWKPPFPASEALLTPQLPFPLEVSLQNASSIPLAASSPGDLFELTYICGGSGELLIGNRSLPVKRGDLLVLGNVSPRRLINRGDAALTVGKLIFDPDLVRGDSPEQSSEYLSPFLRQGHEFPHVVPAKTGVPAQVFDLMQRMRADLPPRDSRARLAVKTYLKMALVLLVNHYASYTVMLEEFERRERALERLRPLFHHLEQNAGDPIQIKDAARICAMSESHFMAFFRAATGRSFTAYLNHWRVERAQALLTGSDKDILDISQELGFCDQSYFSAVFRKMAGVSPAAYRKRFRSFTEPAALARRPRRPRHAAPTALHLDPAQTVASV